MLDNVDINIEFCEEVEKYGTLYDYSRADYCNRNAQDKAWQIIAEKFNASVTECRDRWKNIRGRYTKYKAKLQPKSGQAAKIVKQYYLAPHLLFLDAFIKSRPSKSNIGSGFSRPAIVEEDTEESEDENDDNDDSYDSNARPPNSPSTSTSSCALSCRPSGSKVNETPPSSTNNEIGYRKRKNTAAVNVNDINQQVYQYFETKEQLLKNKNTTNPSTTVALCDPDMAFLQSILPDMKCMNDKKKRKFKIEILNLVETILSDSTSQSFNKENIDMNIIDELIHDNK